MSSKMFNVALMSAVLSLASGAALACGGANSGKHVGNVTSINPDGKTFTIRDAETSKPITFKANADIIKGLKKAGGSVVVNFEENTEGGLQATGVTF